MINTIIINYDDDVGGVIVVTVFATVTQTDIRAVEFEHNLT